MARKTKEQKRIENEVNAAFRLHGNGVQLDIFDIGKVMKAGEDAGAAGLDIGEAMVVAFTKYRKN